MIDLIYILAYLLLGILSGLIGGFGLGGGILIVPVLLVLFDWQGFPINALMHFAVATSLCTITFTAISATYSHHKHQTILWSTVLLLTPGIIIGAFIGALIAHYLPSDILRKIFGCFQIFIAYKLTFIKIKSTHRKLPGKKGMVMVGSSIGTLSSILGIGGGTLTVPFLTWCQIGTHKAVGSASACSFPIALTASIMMGITGMDYSDLPKYNIGYIHWPAALSIIATSTVFAPVGTKIANSMSAQNLKRCLAILLFCIGLKMLF